MSIQLVDVQQFFFAAMLRGYAASLPKTKTPGLPCFKEIDVEEGPWRCLDRYCVNSVSRKSAGTTVIWYENDPVWVMNYGGWYDPMVIDFLKKVLRKNYEALRFDGGRGPEYFEEEFFAYSNFLSVREGFSRFEGREEVRRLPGRFLVGHHNYSGMSLLS